MNQLAHWNPLSEIENMRRRMTTLLNGTTDGSSPSTSIDMWAPVVDIVEDDKAYIFKAELPDVKKENVHLQVENGVLLLTGERRSETEQKVRRVHRIERTQGAFSRGFELPDDADAENVRASFKDGILTIEVPKAEHAKPRRIEINAD